MPSFISSLAVGTVVIPAFEGDEDVPGRTRPRGAARGRRRRAPRRSRRRLEALVHLSTGGGLLRCLVLTLAATGACAGALPLLPTRGADLH